MKRLMILFANGFPYGIGEPFLESEIPLYKDYFDHVLIATACKRGDIPTRDIDDPIIEILPDFTLGKDKKSILEAIPWIMTDWVFYQEFVKLLFGGSVSLKKIQHLIAFALCGNHRAKELYSWLKNHPEYANPVLYSYWMHIPAYAAERLNRKLGKKCLMVTRAHGGDLYLERGVEGYHPFHEHLYREINEIAVISEQGRQYLFDHYGVSEKVSVHRLGAHDQKMENPMGSRSLLRIVTCSRTISLKRLDRIVDALSTIRDIPVIWTHMGDGPVQKELESYARDKLPENVTAEFTGGIPNTQVYERYSQQPFHVFVNVSETEGVPVSIMEAMSFHIPVIATDVGGTSELIDHGENGWLLHKDFTDEDLASRLRQLAELPEEDYERMRHSARRKFEKDYCAETNYKLFLSNFLSMFE